MLHLCRVQAHQLSWVHPCSEGTLPLTVDRLPCHCSWRPPSTIDLPQIAGRSGQTFGLDHLQADVDRPVQRASADHSTASRQTLSPNEESPDLLPPLFRYRPLRFAPSCSCFSLESFGYRALVMTACSPLS